MTLSKLILPLAGLIFLEACGAKPPRLKTKLGNVVAGDPTGDDDSTAGDGKDDDDGEVISIPNDLKLTASPYHRLNRFEYNNAVEDLLGQTTKPANEFPTDPSTHGFDNVAQNLSLTPALIDLMTQATEKIAKAAMNDHPRTEIDINLVAAAGGKNGNAMGTSWSIEGTLPLSIELAQDEELTFVIEMSGRASNAPNPKATFKLNGANVSAMESKGKGDPELVTFKSMLPKGTHSLTISFDNRVDPNAPASIFNTLVVDSIKASSTAMEVTEKSKLLKACQNDACKHEVFLTLAQKAWRRPLVADEKTSLIAVWDASKKAGGTEVDAMKAVIQSIFLSSKFVFRAVNPRDPGAKAVGYIDDYSLASRLSFFLWSSVPDDELYALAEAKKLREPATLRDQVKRMLADPKAKRFPQNFSSQWLFTRLLDQAKPDPNVFKDYDLDLKNAMIMESELMFADFISNGKPISDLLAPGFTFANDRLAKHYGLPLPGSAAPKKVTLADNARGGVLSHAGWLTVTSLPTDTMPVKRGAWVMENILCQLVPIPPPVPPLDVGSVGSEKLTIRQRFEKHLTDKTCASCHNLIDPIGFGLESFDAVGAPRTKDSVGNPLDTKGKLISEPFEDFQGLVAAIEKSKKFEHCVAKKLYSYALGKSAGKEDSPLLEEIEKSAEAKGNSLGSLIEAIVLSPAFRMANFSEDL